MKLCRGVCVADRLQEACLSGTFVQYVPYTSAAVLEQARSKTRTSLLQ